MNESKSGGWVRRLWFAALLGLAACSGPAAEPPLQGARMGGPFTLVDQNGRTVTDGDFAGRYRLIYFGYSFCPDVCPTDLQTIGRALKRFEEEAPQRAARVQPIFITVDPARDTPEILKAFVANFHPRLIGLTGSKEQIGAVTRAFGVAANVPEGAGPDYLVNHSQLAALFGPNGEPIALMHQDQGVAAVAEALNQWVK